MTRNRGDQHRGIQRIVGVKLNCRHFALIAEMHVGIVGVTKPLEAKSS